MNDLLHQAYDAETFRKQGHQLIDQMADYLKNMQQEPGIAVLPWQSPEDRLYSWEADYRQSPDENINRFWGVVMAQSMHIHHPKYVGHQVSPPLPVAALSGLVSAFLNNGMAVYEMGPVASVIERIVIKETAMSIGYSEAAGGFLTSGGTLSNLTALLAARQAKTGYASPRRDSWQQGTQQPLALLVSEEAHYCIDRAVRVMGWGEVGVIKVPVDEHFRMCSDQLEVYYQQAQAAGKQVIAVVGSACTTSTGSYDPLEAIAAFCKQRDLWFHVDGAHGAPAAFSIKYKHLVKGLAQADSVTIDYHKMMLTPALTTALLFKDEQTSYQTFSQQAAYLLSDQQGEWFNSGKRAFECTKRMMSIQVYAIMRTYGKQIFAQNVTYLYDLAQTFTQQIRQRNNFQLALPAQSNIVCFRYAPAHTATDKLSELNAQIRQAMVEDGEFYLVQTSLKGQLYLRTTLMNPFTTEAILAQLLDKVEKIGNDLIKSE